jgi:hypothetical protein
MKRFLLISILIFFCFQLTYSQNQNPIITALPGLSFTPDAIGGGMADVGAATTPNVYSQYYNPAKYAFVKNDAGISISYNSLLRKIAHDVYLGYLAGYYKLDSVSVISATIRNFSLGTISLMDQLGNPIGEVNPGEIALDAAYSRKLSENFSVAAAFRLIYSDLNNGMQFEDNVLYPGSSIAMDLAGYFQKQIKFATGNGNLAIGLNISNIGSKISYDQNITSNFIPTNMRFGVAIDLPLNENIYLKVSADANKLLVPTPDGITDFNKMSAFEGIIRSFSDAPGGFSEELKEISYSVGTELSFYDIGFLRGGYCYQNPQKGSNRYFTIGAGIHFLNIYLDGSYLIATTISNPSDRSFRISLAYNLADLKCWK